MQDTLLRMLVLALGLLTMDDPRIEERDDITTMGLQELEEMLLRGREKLDHEMVPVSEETAHTDSRGPWDDQHDTEEDKMSVLEDVTITKQDSKEDDRDSQGGEHFVANLDPQNPKSEPETTLKTTQIDQEQNRNLQLDMKSKEGEDIQTDSTFRDPSRQGQQENPEGKEVISSKKKTCATYFHKGRARLLCISEHGTLEMPHDDWDYLWYIWNTLSIIFMVRFFRKYLRRNSQVKLEETRVLPVKCRAAEVPLPDSDTLQRFYSKCIQVSSDNKWKDFLEGFANDLLEAMRTVCERSDSMVIEDFQVVDGCDIIIPFNPPDPFSFQCLLWNNQASDLLPDMQACGQIKLVENKKIQTGCPCQSPNSDDMVCLLHCESEKVKTKITDAHNGLLCMKNSPFLSKSQVTRWFQSTIKQAWDQISHKYEFELNIRYVSAPGALVVRFRSGKKIIFNMNPVVEVCTDAHFFITPCSPNNLDTFWTLSLTNYEDRFLENISKHLPKNACHSQTLEIAHFLHKRQTALSGKSELKEFHFKIALMHLLLTKDPSQWKPSHVACRLRDLLAFMEKSLEKKLLHHVLIGNPLTQSIIELPAEFTQAKTVNLFHPLVVHNCIYRDAVTHFQEMLRNAHMLIQDYVECSDSCSI